MDYAKIITHLVAFLSGTFIGAAGKYFADKNTDKRRTKEREKEKNIKFRKVAVEMPKLIEQMHTDLINPECTMARVFIVIHSKTYLDVRLDMRDWLVYCEEDHDKLKQKLKLLEKAGYISKITNEKFLTYEMEEDFVNYVKNFKIKNRNDGI
jgi:hypothetical protein